VLDVLPNGRRAGFPPAVREDIKHAYKLLYRSGLNVSHAVAAIERECKSPEVKHLVDFVKSSKRGICAGISSDAVEGDDESLLPIRRVPTNEVSRTMPRKTLRNVAEKSAEKSV
jgi:hypothetical protein